MKKFFNIILGTALCAAQFAALSAVADTYSYLPVERRMLFNKWEETPPGGAAGLYDFGDYYANWTHTGPEMTGRAAALRLLGGTNHIHTSGWQVYGVRTGSASLQGQKQIVPPEEYSFSGVAYTNWAANLQNILGAAVQSPVYDDGVGVLYFDAANVFSTITPDVVVEFATNKVTASNGYLPINLGSGTFAWNAVTNFTVNGIGRYAIPINIVNPVSVRIRRSTKSSASTALDTYFLTVDNICVSYPHGKLTVETPTITKVSGQPTAAYITCKVSNASGLPNALKTDHTSRQVTVYYRGGDGNYLTAAMDYKAGTGTSGDEEEYFATVEFPDGPDTEKITAYCVATDTFDRYLPVDYTQNGYNYWETDDHSEPPPQFVSGIRTVDVSNWSLANVATSLPVERRMLFNKWEEQDSDTGLPVLNDLGDYYSAEWEHIGPVITGRPATRRLLDATNHFHTSGWRIYGARTGSSSLVSGQTIVQPDMYSFSTGSLGSYTNWAANLLNTTGVSIESPVYTNGIGTIYFDAINNYASTPATLKLQVTTNMVDRAYSYTEPIDMMAPYEYDEVDAVDPTLIHEYRYYWTDLDEIVLDQASMEGDNPVVRYMNKMEYRGIIKFRLVRMDSSSAGEDSAFAVIDNIQVSQPPSDLVVYDDDMTFVPPYPAPGEPFRIRCRVKNVDMNVPTDHNSRSVTVYYRWRYLDQKVNDWSSMTMSYVPGADGDDGLGNGELYEAGIAGQDMEGDLEYYFVCNFDGYRYKPTDYTLLGYKYLESNNEPGTESLSPRALRSDTGKDFALRIRKATTNYKQLYIVTDKHSEPIEMTLMDNETWWGWIPLNVGSFSIDSFRFNFMGIGGYDSATQMTNSVPTYWAEVGQGAAATPPSGGVCVEATETDRMAIECDNAHYALVRFEIGTGNYTICKADYQNFNNWVANDAVFSDYSDFAESARKVSSNTTFEAWTHSEDDYYTENFIGFPEVPGTYSRAFTTLSGWYAAAAKYEKEVGKADANNMPSGYTSEDQIQNIALRMIGSNSLQGNTDGMTELGSISTRPESLTDGIKTISFKARLGTGIDPSRITYFNRGWDIVNYGNLYKIQGTFTISADGPGERSISIIGAYRDDENFVEGRLVLVANTRNLNNPNLRMELHIWTDGVDRIAGTQVIEGNTQSLSGRVLALDFTNGNVVFSQGTGTNEKKVTTSFSSSISGTFGFMSSDCSVSVGTLYYNKRDQAASRMDISSNDWATRGLWRISGSMLQMAEKTQKLGVFVQKTKYGSGATPDMSITEWEQVDTVELSGFPYRTVSLTYEHWQAEFVRLQVLPGDYDVVVDELKTTSWHGKQYPPGTSAALNMQWLVTEGWIMADTANSANTVVRLDLTRASLDPDATYPNGQTQGIRSPLLVDGCGSLEFDCRVPRGPVRLTVQYTGRWTTDWQDYKTIVLPANNNWTHYSFYIGNTNGGYMRVVNDRRGGANVDEVYYSSGIVEFNNITAWNEPYVDAESWYAYNAKVTDQDATRLILDATRGCYLNNSQTAEASPLQDQHQPFLQAPLLAGGLGEISFDARPYNLGETAQVFIYGTTGGWYGQDSDWELLDTIDVSGEWFSTYRWGAGQDGTKYKAVRLQTVVGGKRVCLENVSVSEPVFPGFDISSTRPICQNSDFEYNLASGQQPLASDKVGIEARLSNMRMSPTNIEVYVCYYVGTNVWGVSNYRNSGDRKILKMYQAADDPQIYRTSPDDDLGYFDAGDVIQYYVYATYTDADGLTSYYEEQSDFTNPSWYEPMNLNSKLADQGWSPYFLIYDIPKGTVFINEINVYETTSLKSDTENCVYAIPYIELAMPEDIDLVGWNLLFVSAPDMVLDHGTTTNRLAIASTASKTAVTNGYSYWVVSVDNARLRQYNLPTQPKYIDQGSSMLSSYMASYSTIALMLQRPSGIVEEVLAFRGYTDNSNYADQLAESDPYHRAISLGGEIAGGSLSVLTNNGFTATDWKAAAKWTPGLPNEDQVLPPIPQIFPGVSNVVVTGTLNNYSLATQNGASRKISFKVSRGTSTNIVYECAEWYRILAVTTNGAAVKLPDGGATNRVYTLDLPNLTETMDVVATVGLSSDLTKQNLDPDVRDWVMQYDDGSIVESTFNGKPMTLTELYWFNANPTVSHVFLGENVSLEKDENTNHWLTIHFTIDGNNCTSLWGGATLKLKMRKSLTEEELSSGAYKDGWRFLTQYAVLPDSFDANHNCRIYIPYEYLLRKAPDWDLSDIFIIWRVQFDEESDYILPLVNTPKE